MKTSPKVFVTLCMNLWDPKTGTLHFTQAGHDPILHYSAADKAVAELAHGGMALGMIPDVSKTIKTQSVQPGAGDVFVLYTDGIPEAWQSETESYGMDRFKASIQKNSALATAQEIHDAILNDVRSFMGDYPQADDITLLVLKRTG